MSRTVVTDKLAKVAKRIIWVNRFNVFSGTLFAANIPAQIPAAAAGIVTTETESAL